MPGKAVKIIEQYKQFKENKDGLVFPDLKECDLENKFNIPVLDIQPLCDEYKL
jgi:hypothetical protein